MRNRRRKQRARDALDRLGALAGLTPARSAEPGELFSRAEARTELYAILDQMRDRYRTVLILFELEGHSGEEIAGALEVKTATVWVWLHRARQDFLRRLEALRG